MAGMGCLSSRPSAPDSFLVQASRNAVQSPIRDLDEAEFIKFLRKQAEKAWSQLEEACQARGREFSPAYHNGFVQGFVDYVEAGGTGEPPYLPPFRYRLTHWRNAEGNATIDDWYAGFRHGAAVAKESGLRQFNIIPLPAPAIPIDPSTTTPPDLGKPASTARSTGQGSPWDQPGKLPPPRPIPPATAPTTAPEPRIIPVPPGPQEVPPVPNLPGQPLQPVPAVPSVQQIVVPVAPTVATTRSELNRSNPPGDPWTTPAEKTKSESGPN